MWCVGCSQDGLVIGLLLSISHRQCQLGVLYLDSPCSTLLTHELLGKVPEAVTGTSSGVNVFSVADGKSSNTF